MKKLLLALPIVAGASWAGTSYYAGVQSETAYDNLLNQLQLMKPLTFEKESFENGLTTSNAITVVRESASADAPIVLRLMHEISHSPVRMEDGATQVGNATIRTTIINDSANDELNKIRGFFKGKEPIEVITTVGMGGDVESLVNVSALEIDGLKDGASLSMDESSFTVSLQGSKANAKGTAGAIQYLHSDGSAINGAQSTFAFDGTLNGSNLYDYDMRWDMDTLSMNPIDASEKIVLSDLSIGVDTDLAGDAMNQNLFFDVKDIDLGESMPKEMAPISSGRLDVAVNNVSLKAMESYHEMANNFSFSEQINPSDEVMQEAMSAVVGLITPNVELDYELTLANAGGVANAGFLIRFAGDGSETGRDYIVTAGDVLNAIEVEVDVRADKAAVELTPAAGFMYSPQAQMALLDNGDHYAGKATLKNAVGDLNGQQFPLQDMLGEMLDMPLETLMQMQGL